LHSAQPILHNDREAASDPAGLRSDQKRPAIRECVRLRVKRKQLPGPPLSLGNIGALALRRISRRRILMSLFPTKESGNWEARTDNVYFVMTSGGHRVRCGVTGQALEALEPKLEQTGRRRLDAFEAHRAIVERIASEKFDNSKWEWDGITVLVKDIDITRG
jgi:Protein of unknown function (DUF1488)